MIPKECASGAKILDKTLQRPYMDGELLCSLIPDQHRRAPGDQGPMTRCSRLILATVIVAVSLATSPAAEHRISDAAGLTVGDLAQELARVVERTRTGQALQAPIESRIDRAMAGRPGARLTEGAAASLLRAVGIEATTSHPGRLISREEGRALLRQVEMTHGSPEGLFGQGSAQPAAPQPPSGNLPEECREEPNHGRCVECCKAEGFRTSTCARFCFQVKKQSPSEPLP
jgi:hypothetical protein